MWCQVILQSLMHVTAAREYRSEASLWAACMKSLGSAAAALECAVISVLKTAAGRKVSPDTISACCMAVDCLLGAAVRLPGIVKRSWLALLHGANQPSMPCCASHVALGPWQPRRRTLPLLLSCGHVIASSARVLQSSE